MSETTIHTACLECRDGTPENELCAWCILELNESRGSAAATVLSEEMDDPDPSDIGAALVYAILARPEEFTDLRKAMLYALGVHGHPERTDGDPGTLDPPVAS